MNRVVGNALLSLIALASVSHAQTKRALLVGIDTYESPNPSLPKTPLGPDGTHGRFDLRLWPNLNGAVNDVHAIEALLASPKFAFARDPRHMHTLINAVATRDGILGAMRRYLVDEADAGDTVVFYFAGHGSLRKNSRSRKNSNLLDNTIVPADAGTGVFDVRDREIARIFHAALDKGVILTAIFDSCHSGAVARGIPLGGDNVAVRYLAYDPRDIDEGPDMKDGKEVSAPEERADNPAMVFSAAQSDEVAQEQSFGGEKHGIFTAALIEALRGLPVDTPAKDVYKRIKVLMDGMALQHPQHAVLDGPSARLERPLLGIGARNSKPRFAAVGTTDSGLILLDAGLTANVGPGSELLRVGGGPAVRIRVRSVDGLTRSSADPVDAAGAAIQTGDIFELDRWQPPASDPLTVWSPYTTLSQSDLANAAREFSSLRARPDIVMVEDPALQAPTHMLSWDGKQWILSSATEKGSISLGAHASAETVSAKLKFPKPRLFLNLPPSRELADLLTRRLSQSNVREVDSESKAMYWLVGTLSANSLRYAWFRRAALEQAATTLQASNPPPRAEDPGCSPDSPYPIRSNWVPLPPNGGVAQTAGSLFVLVSRLARLRGWLELPTAFGGSTDFPYTLALKRLPDGAYTGKNPTIEGERYDLVLQADDPRAFVNPRWVYVLGIDCSGRGNLLFPFALGENRFPQEGQPLEIRLPLPRGNSVEIGPPFGMDTYILLSTSEPLPDPGVLNFEGDARSPIGSNPLQDLLRSAIEGTRAASIVAGAPTEWGVQYLHVQSVPKPVTRSK